MALTVSQRDAKIKAIDAKITKTEKLVGDLDALRAEKAWYEAAPTVADRPKTERKSRKTAEQKAAEAAAEAAAAAPESA